MFTSFDAEKFLEELGFAGAKEPLIPDRFIPSLMHRVWSLSDEAMRRLDVRVWKSIELFEKKEHVLWFFTDSSVECDLCINSFQRTHSSPAAVYQGSCDSWHPGCDFSMMRSNGNAAVRVQNWLARFRDNSFTWEESEALNGRENIAYIGNQQSTESGIVSIVEDDEALVESGNDSGNLCCVYDCIEPSEVVHSEVAPSQLMPAESRTAATIEDPTVKEQYKIVPETTVFSSPICERSSTSNGERSVCCADHNAENHRLSNFCGFCKDKNEQIGTVRIQSHSKHADTSISAMTKPSDEELCDHVEEDLRKNFFKKMPTDGQLFLFLPHQDRASTEGENGTSSESKRRDTHSLANMAELGYAQVGDANDRDAIECDCVFTSAHRGKRHSFDAAYASITAAEKRKRFRLSHTRSHNFLFEREGTGSYQDNLVNEVVSDETPLWESRVKCDPNEMSPTGQFTTFHDLQHPDTSSHSGSKGGFCFETSRMTSSSESTDECWTCSRSDSDGSEEYFSCDEFLTVDDEKLVKETSDFSKQEDTVAEICSGSRTDFDVCLPAGETTAFAETVSQLFSQDKGSLQDCYGIYTQNPTFYATAKENFILNKILRHSLKLSIPGSVRAKSKFFMLQNGRYQNEAESFSQILNTNDSSGSIKLKVLEPNVQSLKYITRTSYDAVRNPGTQVKSMDGRTIDKTSPPDNEHCIFKPFVRNLSLPPDMSAPRCEVRLIKYDGFALFWPARHTAERDMKCSSRLTDSMPWESDFTSDGRFTSCIRMEINSEDSTDNKVYFNEVCIQVNDEGDGGPEEKRSEKNDEIENPHREKDPRGVEPVGFRNGAEAAKSADNPCGRALKDLEDLRIAIQKAKETRMSASRELKLLQELLQGSDNEEQETLSERTSVAADEWTSSVTRVVSGEHRDVRNLNALSELEQKSTKDTWKDKEFWEERIRKTKEEMNQVCHERLNIMEQKLRATEEDLARALEENGRLKDQLEVRSNALTVCKCNAAEAHNSDFSHMNGISHEDAKITSVVAKPSIPTKNFWQEWERLQSDLMKAERKADELNILLNQKLIELNKMQLMLSKQTKEMILLEMAYFELRRHLSKRRLNKSAFSNHSPSLIKASSLTVQGTSEDSSKASDPEIPP